MGLLDDAKNKATQFANDNPDKVEQISDQAIERAGDAVDSKTGGKFADQVDQAQQTADGKIGE